MSMDITFLTEEQIWGDKALQVMKSYGTKTGLSDLTVVLGGAIVGSSKTSDNQLSGYVWSASSDGGGDVRLVRDGGDQGSCYPFQRLVAARPALPSSIASSIKSSDVSAGALAKGEARLTKRIGDIQVVEFGEYPQAAASESISGELEQSFSRGQLQATGKKFTFDGEELNTHSKPFKAKEYAEYQHGVKGYIRVEAKPYDNDSILSTGRKPETGEACWIEVQPIEWLKDPSGAMVARQALFAGVQFDKNNSYDGNFAKTDMKQYLQNHFAKEMQVSRAIDSPPVVGPHTASVVDGRALQRQRVLENPREGI